MISFLKNGLRLDYRAIALMRIALSVVVILDIFIRWSDLSAFYIDDGILPRQMLNEYAGLYWKEFSFSVLTISGSAWVQHILFGAALISASMVLIGHKTRLFTVLTWIWLISVQNRAGVILQSGDDYLRLMFLWGIFLPWGRTFSADSFEKPKLESNEYFGVSSIAIIVQIVSVYLLGALLKTGPEWHSQGSAIYYALSLDQMLKPLGSWLYPYAEVLRLSTRLVLFAEYLIPVLLIIPWQNGFFRKIALIQIWTLHLAIEFSLQVGLFSFISIAASMCLLPSDMIDRMSAGLNKLVQKIWDIFKMLKYTFPYRSPSKDSPPSILVSTFISILVLLGLFWNISKFTGIGENARNEVRPIVHITGLNQHWGMFAPSVFKDDGWFIYEAKYQDQEIDVKNDGAPINYDKPEWIVKQHNNSRWRKFGENLIFSEHLPLRDSYCNFILREWNERHTEPLDTLRVLYMLEKSLPDYRTADIQKEVLCTCTTIEK